MSFRQFGGLNYSSKNNIVTNQFQSSNYFNNTDSIGGANSKIISCSHIDMSNNSFMHVGKIYFADGTVQNTAPSNVDIITQKTIFAGLYSDYTDTRGTTVTVPQFAGGSQYSIPYQTDTSKTGYIPIGPVNSVLSFDSDGISWKYPSVLTVTTTDFHINTQTTTSNGSSTLILSTDSTSDNIASTIVSRDNLGNFSANTIIADLSGTTVNANNIYANIIISDISGTNVSATNIYSSNIYSNNIYNFDASEGSIPYIDSSKKINFLEKPSSENLYITYDTDNNKPIWTSPIVSSDGTASVVTIIENQTISGQKTFSKVGTFTSGLVTNTFSSSGAATLSSTLAVANLSTFNGGINVANSAGTFSGGLATNTFSSSGAATLSSTLAVANLSTFNGGITVANSAGNFSAGLSTNTFSSSGAATLSSTLDVSGSTIFYGGINVSGTYGTFNNGINVTGGGIACTAGLQVKSGKGTFSEGLSTNTFSSSGAATLSSTLAVANLSTFNGGITVSGAAGTFSAGLATNTFSSSGAATLSSTLDVSGISKFYGGITVSGAAGTFSAGLATNTFSSSGAAKLSSTLDVSGATIFYGGITGDLSGNAKTATILSSATVWTIPYYNSSTTSTQFLDISSGSGKFLKSNGQSVPTWENAGLSITDVSNSTTSPYYLNMSITAGTTSGTSVTNISTANSKLTFTPSTGTLNTPIINVTSDYRVKENIISLDDSFVVDNFRPVTYNNKLSGKKDIGFIAHEIQEIYPFLVSGEKDGEQTQSLNYIGLIGVLTKEIQELKKRVQVLENK